MSIPTPDEICERSFSGLMTDALAGHDCPGINCPRCQAAIQATYRYSEQQATIERLSAALEPFVEALDEWGDDERVGDDATLWEHPLGMCITTGDFRRARAALGKDASDE